MTRFHKFFMQALGEQIYTELYKWQSGTHRKPMGSFSFYNLNHHFQLEIDQMARKRKAIVGAPSDTPTAPSKELVWVNVRFEQDELTWITELTANCSQIGERLAALLTEGVGFSVKYNALRSNYSAFVVGIIVEGIGENCGISAFAPDALTATCAVLGKVALLTADAGRGVASGQSVGIG